MPHPKEHDAARLRNIALCAAGFETRQRIERALRLIEVDPPVLTVDPRELVDADLGSATVVVLACDVDLPEELQSVRGISRSQPDSPVLVVTHPVSGGGVRRALDAGAAAVVFEPEIEKSLGSAIAAVA